MESIDQDGDMVVPKSNLQMSVQHKQSEPLTLGAIMHCDRIGDLENKLECSPTLFSDPGCRGNIDKQLESMDERCACCNRGKDMSATRLNKPLHHQILSIIFQSNESYCGSAKYYLLDFTILFYPLPRPLYLGINRLSRYICLLTDIAGGLHRFEKIHKAFWQQCTRRLLSTALKGKQQSIVGGWKTKKGVPQEPCANQRRFPPTLRVHSTAPMSARFVPSISGLVSASC